LKIIGINVLYLLWIDNQYIALDCTLHSHNKIKDTTPQFIAICDGQQNQ